MIKFRLSVQVPEGSTKTATVTAVDLAAAKAVVRSRGYVFLNCLSSEPVDSSAIATEQSSGSFLRSNSGPITSDTAPLFRKDAGDGLMAPPGHPAGTTSKSLFLKIGFCVVLATAVLVSYFTAVNRWEKSTGYANTSVETENINDLRGEFRDPSPGTTSPVRMRTLSISLRRHDDKSGPTSRNSFTLSGVFTLRSKEKIEPPINGFLDANVLQKNEVPVEMFFASTPYQDRDGYFTCEARGTWEFNKVATMRRCLGTDITFTVVAGNFRGTYIADRHLLIGITQRIQEDYNTWKTKQGIDSKQGFLISQLAWIMNGANEPDDVP